jgi:predicted DNA-binding protein
MTQRITEPHERGVAVTVWMPREHRAALDGLCAEKGRSRSWLVRQMIEEAAGGVGDEVTTREKTKGRD